jgi:hypothetical protein
MSDEKIYTFTSSCIFTVPSNVSVSADVLIVAGGGSAGTYGGGGGGGVLYTQASTFTAGTYTLNVGKSDQNSNIYYEDTLLFDVPAGGRGADVDGTGSNGASGGGGSGAQGSQGTGISPYGNDGSAFGGGGGAGTPATTLSGGDGVEYNSVYYGGGGGNEVVYIQPGLGGGNASYGGGGTYLRVPGIPGFASVGGNGIIIIRYTSDVQLHVTA